MYDPARVRRAFRFREYVFLGQVLSDYCQSTEKWRGMRNNIAASLFRNYFTGHGALPDYWEELLAEFMQVYDIPSSRRPVYDSPYMTDGVIGVTRRNGV